MTQAPASIYDLAVTASDDLRLRLSLRYNRTRAIEKLDLDSASKDALLSQDAKAVLQHVQPGKDENTVVNLHIMICIVVDPDVKMAA